MNLPHALSLCVFLCVFWRYAETHQFENGTQQYAYVYANATTSVAFIHNEANVWVLTKFQGLELDMTPGTVFVFDMNENVGVFDSYSIDPPTVQRQFTDVSGLGGRALVRAFLCCTSASRGRLCRCLVRSRGACGRSRCCRRSWRGSRPTTVLLPSSSPR